MVVLILLLMVTGFQLVYWWYYYYFSFSKYKGEKTFSGDLPSVSVLVCFKGLPVDFQKNLMSLIQQKFKDFEIILVNDFSTFDDVKKVEAFMATSGFNNIRLIHAAIDKPGKKQAVKEGVMASTKEVLLFTDIDCRPDSPLWIQKMANQLMAEDAGIVLGFAPMEKLSGPVARFVAFETILTAMQYFSHYFAGSPYMSVGRNWMVKKAAYVMYHSHALGQELASGDDDLTFQAIMPHVKVTHCLDEKAFMYSPPKTSLMDYLRQKTRHVTTSVKYPSQKGLILLLFAVSFPLFYGLILLAIFIYPTLLWVCIGLCLFKWILQTVFHYRMLKTLDKNFLHLSYPFYEITFSIYLVALSVYSIFPQKKW